MCRGDVKVMTLPLTDWICLTSAIGRPARLNQVRESGKGSSTKSSVGLWRMKTARSEAQILTLVGAPLRFGSAVQEAVSYSSASSRTNCPAAKPLPLETVTDIEPLTPLAVRFFDVVSSVPGHRCGPTMMMG